MRTRWEYKIVQPSHLNIATGDKIRSHSEQLLNELGLEGWECYHAKTDTMPTVFYLKRPKDR